MDLIELILAGLLVAGTVILVTFVLVMPQDWCHDARWDKSKGEYIIYHCENEQ